MRPGKVYLVGAGPGDEKLITRRGAELLEQADAVVYDRLVDPKLLTLAPQKAQCIYVGKEADEKGHGQGRIHRLLVQKAGAGARVVRLKGGDPMVFGRLSEELDALRRAGIPYEVVPGVSSVWAAAAAAGIPLTDRRYSSSVAVVAGHEAGGKKRRDWGALAKAVDTLVILMGWAQLPRIVRELRRVRAAETPVAVLRWVSTPAEEKVLSRLGRLEQDLRARPDFGPPVVVIVGQVVRLAGEASSKLLRGKTVVVTRPAGDQQGLVRRLTDLGATCRHLPTIAIRRKTVPAQEAETLLGKLARYDWLVFTSHHGVEALDALAEGRKGRLASLIRGRICAIGPRTAQAVRNAGLVPDLLPDEFSKEGIERTFEGIPVAGKRILIPRSNLGMGDRLAKKLRRRRARVEEVVLYETLPVKIPPGRIRAALRSADAITFTSASTAREFLRRLGEAKLSAPAVLNGRAVVAIGPATAQALQAGGVRRYTIPSRSWTIDGLIEAVVQAVT